MDEALKNKVSQYVHTQFGLYAIVSLDPPVFYVLFDLRAPEQLLPAYRPLFTRLRGRHAYCFLCYTWSLTPGTLDAMTRFERACRAEFPEIAFIHLCNEQRDTAQLAAAGADAVFCNHNCFVDDAIFRPLPDVERRFDAVYNARLTPWKRHELAKQISSLALIYYAPPQWNPDEIHEFRQRFSHAHFFNHVDGDRYRGLDPRSVNVCLNACRVGLCLSAEEGAMYASIEYLLCGLPVVTTPSKGGRDVFFEPEFATTVAPEPEAVRDAVARWVAEPPSRDRIRDATLARMRVHRQTFIERVQEIYDRHGAGRRFADEWPKVFFHRMTDRRRHKDTIALLETAWSGRTALP